MSDLALSVRDLSKSFPLAPRRPRATTLAEALAAFAKNPLRRIERETFFALRDVSFDVPRGEVLGIVGRNGAGKSTLLKILSQITEPTHGEVRVRGRVGSLLEVGTGFHLELSGRENIFLNGAILGMSRREIARRFDAIVEFAGVAPFLDTPVKRYSSGMFVRLAFAVAAHLEPEILIIDEVLAVGDAEFQKKCLGKMSEVARDGRTVIFVSHAVPAVRRLCTDCLLLDAGRLVDRGAPLAITQKYLDSQRRDDGELAHGDGPCRVRVILENPAGDRMHAWRLGENLRIRVELETDEKLWRPAVDVSFHDADRQRLFVLQSDKLGPSPEQIEGRSSLEFDLENPGFTLPEIVVDIGVRQGPAEYVALFLDAARLAIDAASLPEGARNDCVLFPKAKSAWGKK